MKLIEKFPVGIASMCLGRAVHHDLETKVKACSDAGYQGIELFYEDIKLPARKDYSGTFEEQLLQSAQKFRDLCDQYNLTVFVFQPFKNYEGLLSEKRHSEKIAKLHVWIKIAKIIGTNMIQIPSMFNAKGNTGDIAHIVKDLQEVADIGAPHGIKFGYEALSWGTHVDTWQTAWKIVKLVDRDNLGLVLDTYHFLSAIYGDCTSKDGYFPNALDALKKDMAEFKAEIDISKVYYVQLSDASKQINPPIGPSHPDYDANMKPNMMWSRNFRVFPHEPELGGYMPAEELLRSWIFECGFRGWVSMEIFNKSMLDPAPTVPVSHAQRGIRSWKKIVANLKLDEIDED